MATHLSNGPLNQRSTGLAGMVGILKGVHWITEVLLLHPVSHSIPTVIERDRLKHEAKGGRGEGGEAK